MPEPMISPSLGACSPLPFRLSPLFPHFSPLFVRFHPREGEPSPFFVRPG